MKYTIVVNVPDELAKLLHAGDQENSGLDEFKPDKEAEPVDEDWGDDAADDPWDDEAEESKPTKSRRRSNTKNESPEDKPKIPRSGTYKVNSDKGVRYWTFGKDDAPECHCGMPAAYVKGKTNGRKWFVWWCPLKFSRDSYKAACNFQEWTSGD